MQNSKAIFRQMKQISQNYGNDYVKHTALLSTVNRKYYKYLCAVRKKNYSELNTSFLLTSDLRREWQLFLDVYNVQHKFLKLSLIKCMKPYSFHIENVSNTTDSIFSTIRDMRKLVSSNSYPYRILDGQSTNNNVNSIGSAICKIRQPCRELHQCHSKNAFSKQDENKCLLKSFKCDKIITTDISNSALNKSFNMMKSTPNKISSDTVPSKLCNKTSKFLIPNISESKSCCMMPYTLHMQYKNSIYQNSAHKIFKTITAMKSSSSSSENSDDKTSKDKGLESIVIPLAAKKLPGSVRKLCEISYKSSAPVSKKVQVPQKLLEDYESSFRITKTKQNTPISSNMSSEVPHKGSYEYSIGNISCKKPTESKCGVKADVCKKLIQKSIKQQLDHMTSEEPSKKKKEYDMKRTEVLCKELIKKKMEQYIKNQISETPCQLYTNIKIKPLSEITDIPCERQKATKKPVIQGIQTEVFSDSFTKPTEEKSKPVKVKSCNDEMNRIKQKCRYKRKGSKNVISKLRDDKLTLSIINLFKKVLKYMNIKEHKQKLVTHATRITGKHLRSPGTSCKSRKRKSDFTKLKFSKKEKESSSTTKSKEKEQIHDHGRQEDIRKKMRALLPRSDKLPIKEKPAKSAEYKPTTTTTKKSKPDCDKKKDALLRRAKFEPSVPSKSQMQKQTIDDVKAGKISKSNIKAEILSTPKEKEKCKVGQPHPLVSQYKIESPSNVNLKEKSTNDKTSKVTNISKSFSRSSSPKMKEKVKCSSESELPQLSESQYRVKRPTISKKIKLPPTSKLPPKISNNIKSNKSPPHKPDSKISVCDPNARPLYPCQPESVSSMPSICCKIENQSKECKSDYKRVCKSVSEEPKAHAPCKSVCDDKTEPSKPKSYSNLSATLAAQPKQSKFYKSDPKVCNSNKTPSYPCQRETFLVGNTTNICDSPKKPCKSEELNICGSIPKPHDPCKSEKPSTPKSCDPCKSEKPGICGSTQSCNPCKIEKSCDPCNSEELNICGSTPKPHDPCKSEKPSTPKSCDPCKSEKPGICGSTQSCNPCKTEKPSTPKHDPWQKLATDGIKPGKLSKSDTKAEVLSTPKGKEKCKVPQPSESQYRIVRPSSATLKEKSINDKTSEVPITSKSFSRSSSPKMKEKVNCSSESKLPQLSESQYRVKRPTISRKIKLPPTSKLPPKILNNIKSNKSTEHKPDSKISVCDPNARPLYPCKPESVSSTTSICYKIENQSKECKSDCKPGCKSEKPSICGSVPKPCEPCKCKKPSICGSVPKPCEPCKCKKPSICGCTPKPYDPCKSEKPSTSKPCDPCKSEKPNICGSTPKTYDPCKSEKSRICDSTQDPRKIEKLSTPKSCDPRKSEKPGICDSTQSCKPCKIEKPCDPCKSEELNICGSTPKPHDPCKSEKPSTPKSCDPCKSEKPGICGSTQLCNPCKIEKPCDPCKSEELNICGSTPKPHDPCKSEKPSTRKSCDPCKSEELNICGSTPKPHDPCKSEKPSTPKSCDPCKSEELNICGSTPKPHDPCKSKKPSTPKSCDPCKSEEQNLHRICYKRSLARTQSSNKPPCKEDFEDPPCKTDEKDMKMEEEHEFDIAPCVFQEKNLGSHEISKHGIYKNPEYYSYHKTSFHHIIKMLEDKRLPQPSKYCPYEAEGLLAERNHMKQKGKETQ